MESPVDWPDRAEAWLRRDLALLTEAEGWRPLPAPGDLELWSRPMPDDPNHLFRWRIPTLDAPADVVFEGFVVRILEYHQEWTKEYVGGFVVAEPAPGVRIIHQQFDPGLPGISPRDLCSIEIVRELAPGVQLASFRSIDAMPIEPGHERIDWWGAALCRTHEDGVHSELIYLDRENQAGWFPTWLMNRMMPGYLVLQAQQVRRFFTGGGPAELRRGR